MPPGVKPGPNVLQQFTYISRADTRPDYPYYLL